MPESNRALQLRTPSSSTWRHGGPTGRAIWAFGIHDQSLRRLPGGQGVCWSDGRLVLKPVGYAAEHRWVCQVYAEWRAHDDVRVAEPVEPHEADEPGGWSVDGWAAQVFVAGRETDLPREVDRVKEASEAFHHHIRDLPRPAFLDLRDDPWAFGDRLAWEDGPAEGDAETLELIDRIRSQLAVDHLARAADDTVPVTDPPDRDPGPDYRGGGSVLEARRLAARGEAQWGRRGEKLTDVLLVGNGDDDSVVPGWGAVVGNTGRASDERDGSGLTGLQGSTDSGAGVHPGAGACDAPVQVEQDGGERFVGVERGRFLSDVAHQHVPAKVLPWSDDAHLEDGLQIEVRVFCGGGRSVPPLSRPWRLQPGRARSRVRPAADGHFHDVAVLLQELLREPLPIGA